MPDVFDLAPKIELHLHLEGAIPKPALWKLIERYGDSRVHRPDDLETLFEYRDFAHFIDTWQWMLPLIRTADDFTMIAEAVANSLADQHIVYAEASISPTDFSKHDLSVADIATAVRRGLDRVAGTRVALLVDLVRDTGPKRCRRTLEETIEVAAESSIVGITIGGSEVPYPPALYASVYRRAEAAGLGLTAHAGEAAGPEYVWSALRDLGVSRIGHGIRAVEDPELVAHLVQKQIPLEVCPTSNIRTGVAQSWEQHPVIELIEAGARVTINSDDPLFFDSSVAGDLRRLAALMDLDAERHTQNAIEASWMSADDKSRLGAEVSDWWRRQTADSSTR